MTDDQSQESFTEEQADSLLESIEQPTHEMANTQEMKQSRRHLCKNMNLSIVVRK